MSGTMAIEEKMLRSLKSAVTYLENSVLALDKEDEDLLADNIWHAAAELEYALFLLSITTQNENGVTELRSNRRSKEDDVDSALVGVKNLLNETQKLVLGGRPQDAYESAYAARHRLLKIKDNLAKKRREMLKKK
jgi:hypothetical protein